MDYDENTSADALILVIDQHLEEAFEKNDQAYVVVPTKYIVKE